jgi:hypothetical protein
MSGMARRRPSSEETSSLVLVLGRWWRRRQRVALEAMWWVRMLGWIGRMESGFSMPLFLVSC